MKGSVQAAVGAEECLRRFKFLVGSIAVMAVHDFQTNGHHQWIRRGLLWLLERSAVKAQEERKALGYD